MDDLPAVDPDAWAPLFDPGDFNDAHRPLELEPYRLSSEDLEIWAERCTEIRANISERA